MNFTANQTRFHIIIFALGLLLVTGCKTAHEAGTPGYLYTTETNDTLEAIAAEYRNQGVDVTADQILAENPGLNTNLVAGVQLFIPDPNAIGAEPVKLILPRLIEPLKFADFTVSSINSEGASNLMSQKIKIGTDDPNAYNFLSRNGTNIETETVDEYRAALKAGYTPFTTADMATQSWFIEANQVLGFMERAKPSRQSLFSANDLKYLPVLLLNWNEWDEGEQLKMDAEKGMTLDDCTSISAQHHIHALKIKGNTMTFSDDICDYRVVELASGDLDGDGYEDALIMVSTYYQGGSGRGYATWIVSRTDPKQRQLKLSLLDTGIKTATDTASTNLFLKCSPNIVKLVGTITNETFPGPPNYKSVAKGDEPEDYWILKLESPVDVAEDPEYPVPDENRSQLNVTDLQIDLGGDYTTYAKLLGKKVVVTGELAQGFTVHHKTTVLIGVRDIKLAE